MPSDLASFSTTFTEWFESADPQERAVAEKILRPLNCLRMAMVNCEMEFDQMDVMIALSQSVGLLVVITDNPVRATVELEWLDDPL